MSRVCQAGFTLIEVIVVVVLLGVLSVGAGMLISRPVEIYDTQARRQQLIDLAEISLRQIAADIRRALPNSIRVTSNGTTSWALEMASTVDGGRYRDEAGGGFTNDDDILQFTVNDSRFNVLGQLVNLGIGAFPGHRVVIYNTNTPVFYAAAANNPTIGVISNAGLSVQNNAGSHQVVMDTPHRFVFQSPSQRFFIVDGPVSYICDSNSRLLKRYSNYAFKVNQNSIDSIAELDAEPGVSAGQITNGVSSCRISYQQGTATRGALVTLDLSITEQGNTVRLMHQVHVNNVP